MSMSGEVFGNPDFEAAVVNLAITGELRGMQAQGVAFEDMPDDPRLQRIAQFVGPELSAASAKYDVLIDPIMERLRADEAALIAAGSSPEEARRTIQASVLEAFIDVHTKEGEYDG
jgi:hypothetical protein